MVGMWNHQEASSFTCVGSVDFHLEPPLRLLTHWSWQQNVWGQPLHLGILTMLASGYLNCLYVKSVFQKQTKGASKLESTLPYNLVSEGKHHHFHLILFITNEIKACKIPKGKSIVYTSWLVKFQSHIVDEHVGVIIAFTISHKGYHRVYQARRYSYYTNKYCM